MARDIRIVLVRPRNPVNIGAVARVMANFGFRDLVVVNPYPPAWEEARRGGPGAESVLAAARNVATLGEALTGCKLVAGATAGTRRQPQPGHSLLAPAAFKPKGKTALVFGSEKTGLSNEDFSYCHVLLRIPTTPATPSMNLAAAVAVCCYELARVRGRSPGPSPKSQVKVDELLRLLEAAAAVLETAGFLDPQRRASHLRKLRQILLRANLRPEDVALLTAAADKLRYSLLGPGPRTAAPPQAAGH